MKRYLLALGLGVLGIAQAWAIPSAITYQGALKDKGVPATGTRQMSFRITNQDGTQVYWSSANMPVPVTNGLFSAKISPTGVDWEAVTPYLEVSVEGQQLLPREAVNAGVYALVANNVVDGAIAPTKVAAGYGLVPAGMIGMFATSCPSGWTYFSALEGMFPLGGAGFGATGGSNAHSHSLTVMRTVPGAGPSVIGTKQAGDGSLLSYPMSGSDRVDVRSADTTTQSHVPPYLTVVYCQKS